MNNEERHSTVGTDELNEFGQRLTTLVDSSRRQYTFEMPNSTGRLRKCTLGDVLDHFQRFCDRKADAFRACICYVDIEAKKVEKWPGLPINNNIATDLRNRLFSFSQAS